DDVRRIAFASVSNDPSVVCAGQDTVADCIALVRRRIVEMRAVGKGGLLPLVAVPGCAAHLRDVAAFVNGDVDDDRILELVGPLMALDWAAVDRGGPPHAPDDATPARGLELDALYASVRLCHLPAPISMRAGTFTVRIDPEAIARLASGDLAAAIRVCARRLVSSGLIPIVREGASSPALARRLAASLAFPIDHAGVAHCVDLALKRSSPSSLDLTRRLP
ncbi:MAG: hypothetical protein KF819_41175, partial [Labilithrix sp.]|nr:hypothetical protein [Labilithrix sp.]